MSNKVCIVLVGGPCSGKSSVGKSVATKLNINYISSGDIAREMAKSNNAIKTALDNGKFAPEDKMRASISNKLHELFKVRDRDIVILDGFPRFGEQAEWLRNELPANINTKYVLIHAPSWVLRDRAKSRNRHDDYSFEQRLDHYRKVTYEELYKYLNTIIHTDHMNIDECAMVLIDYIKEVTSDVPADC